MHDIAIVVSDKKLLDTGDLVPSGRAAQQIDEDFPPVMRPKDYEEQNRKTVKHQLTRKKKTTSIKIIKNKNIKT